LPGAAQGCVARDAVCGINHCALDEQAEKRQWWSRLRAECEMKIKRIGPIEIVCAIECKTCMCAVYVYRSALENTRRLLNGALVTRAISREPRIRETEMIKADVGKLKTALATGVMDPHTSQHGVDVVTNAFLITRC
jgi:hypothetical protein